MPNLGMVTLWATDFDQGSFDNCEVTSYLMVSPSEGPGQSAPPINAADSWVFNCADLGTQSVDLWVEDSNGNWDYCTTYVIIQDQDGFCGDLPAAISGAIDTGSGDYIESVSVSLEGGMPGLPDPQITGVEGLFEFSNLVNGYDYVVAPDKDINPLNGVSTYDLVLITRHILGVEPLDSPYKLIAADINRSGSISTYDIVQLRRLILLVDEQFTDNTSWRFIRSDYTFPNPANPFATNFPEVYTIDHLGGNSIADFVGVKIGDVSGNAIANSWMEQVEERSEEDRLRIEVKDRQLVKGQTYRVDFRAPDFARINGYQFTLQFNPEELELIDIEPLVNTMSRQHFGARQQELGIITTSWNEVGQTVSNDNQLFRLVFKAREHGLLSDLLEINSDWTIAEAYDRNAMILPIALVFRDQLTTATEPAFTWYPAQPNPFAHQTTIAFVLPQATTATFTIQDASGKIVKVEETNLTEGYHEIIIDQEELQGPGVYFYTLQTETHRRTGRTVLLKL